MSKDNPFGDDGGDRVGRPDTPKRDNVGDGDGDKTTGAGTEAVRGIVNKNKKGSTTPSTTKPGSEPLEERGNEHKSGYGGEGGQPRTSSDQH